MRITFLGTGTSVGIPRIGCKCLVCRSDEPKNKRLRCSILLEYSDHAVLIDTTPDLRTQALRYGVDQVDAVLFTHAHADHLHGLDDVRSYCFDRDDPMPCYGSESTLERIRHVFDYAFNSPYKHAIPQLALHCLDGPLELFGRTVQPLTVYHGKAPVLAFRLGGFAYVTDCNAIPPETMAQLQGLDILVLDALRPKKHPTHFSLNQALDVVKALKPGHTYFTHMAHELDHYPTNAALPPNIELAYDGLILNHD